MTNSLFYVNYTDNDKQVRPAQQFVKLSFLQVTTPTASCEKDLFLVIMDLEVERVQISGFLSQDNFNRYLGYLG